VKIALPVAILQEAEAGGMRSAEFQGGVGKRLDDILGRGRHRLRQSD
jgi:hypothetical protein